jgi:hypothetical protein
LAAPTVTLRLASGDRIPAHRHDDHQIVYPGRGVLAVTTDKGSWIAPSTTTTITQLGSTVGIGLLLDTLIVPSFLLPSLMALIGGWFWWPSRPPQSPPGETPPPAERRRFTTQRPEHNALKHQTNQ